MKRQEIKYLKKSVWKLYMIWFQLYDVLEKAKL